MVVQWELPCHVSYTKMFMAVWDQAFKLWQGKKYSLIC